jgi:hypothetical protein
MPKNNWGVEMKPALPMTVPTVWVTSMTEVDEDNESHWTLICCSQEYDVAWAAFIDTLPDWVEHWTMRYNYWSQDKYDKVLQIVPLLPTYGWLKVSSADFGRKDHPLYNLHRDYSDDAVEGEEVPLTVEQKEQLYKLLGSTWDRTSSSHVTYDFEKVAMIPIG